MERERRVAVEELHALPLGATTPMLEARSPAVGGAGGAEARDACGAGRGHAHPASETKAGAGRRRRRRRGIFQGGSLGRAALAQAQLQVDGDSESEDGTDEEKEEEGAGAGETGARNSNGGLSRGLHRTRTLTAGALSGLARGQAGGVMVDSLYQPASQGAGGHSRGTEPTSTSGLDESFVSNASERPETGARAAFHALAGASLKRFMQQTTDTVEAAARGRGRGRVRTRSSSSAGDLGVAVPRASSVRSASTGATSVGSKRSRREMEEAMGLEVGLGEGDAGVEVLLDGVAGAADETDGDAPGPKHARPRGSSRQASSRGRRAATGRWSAGTTTKKRGASMDGSRQPLARQSTLPGTGSTTDALPGGRMGGRGAKLNASSAGPARMARARSASCAVEASRGRGFHRPQRGRNLRQ